MTANAKNIKFHSPIHADVKSESTNEIYHVNIENGTCTCKDYLFRGLNTPGHKCKHLNRVLDILEA